MVAWACETNSSWGWLTPIQTLIQYIVNIDKLSNI